MINWCEQPIYRLAQAIEKKVVSVREVIDSTLSRIAAHDRSLNVYTAVLADRARYEADKADQLIATGHYRGPLHGVPISIKDLIDVAGVPTTSASRASNPTAAERDATAVARLRTAGAIIIGKCNLHEFAFGTTGEDSCFGPTLHPLDKTRSPGGSSSGSAVSVATGMAFGSVGTDTGGSIRIPSAACGLVGLKPTFGEISCDGVTPLAPSLDHVGPLARCVEDARLLYETMRNTPPDPENTALPTRRILGCPKPFFLEQLDREIRTSFEHSLTRLQSTGWIIRDTAVDHALYSPAVCLHLVLSEAAATHMRGLTTRADHYTDGVRLRLELGRYVMGEDYARAHHGRLVLGEAIDAALDSCDALVLPTLPIPAPQLATTTVNIGNQPEPLRSVMLRLTQLFNATGHPAISLPCGLTTGGLPCGLQLIGRLNHTDHLLNVAEAIEVALNDRPRPTAQ